MIREYRLEDKNEVMKIWLDCNIKAHYFIPKEYWENHYEQVEREYLSIAKTWVYEVQNEVVAFVSIIDGKYIGGLFVIEKMQNQKIGSELLTFCKSQCDTLYLNVYQENIKAVKFYRAREFKKIKEQMDEGTGHQEYLMQWEQSRS